MLVASLFWTSALAGGFHAPVVSPCWAWIPWRLTSHVIAARQGLSEEERAGVFRALQSTLSDCSYELRVDRVQIEGGVEALHGVAPAIDRAYQAAAEAPFSFAELGDEFARLLVRSPPGDGVTFSAPLRLRVAYTKARHVERTIEPAPMLRLRSEPLELTYWPGDRQLNLANADGQVAYFSPEYLLQPLPVVPTQIEQLRHWTWQSLGKSSEGSVYRVRGRADQNYYSYQTTGAPAHLPLACCLQPAGEGQFGYASFYGYEADGQGVLRFAGAIAVREFGGSIELERLLVSDYVSSVDAEELLLRIEEPKLILDERGRRIATIESTDQLSDSVRQLIQVVEKR